MKIVSICIILITFFPLFGCKENRKSDKIEVTFWHVMGGPLGKTLNSLIDEFNRENPDIHITSISMGNYQALSQKIMASVLAKNPPTLAQVYESWTASLKNANVIEPIQKFIDGKNGLTKKDIDDIFPVFVRDNEWNEKFITFPFNKSVTTYFYNVDMFKKNGIDHFPETWNEFLLVAKKLTKDKVWGTAFPVSASMFEQMLYAKGGKLLDNTGEKAVFDSKEGCEALQFIYDLIYKYKVAHLTTGYEHQDEFLAGKVAMISGSSVSYAFIQLSKPNFEIGLGPAPSDKERVVFIAGTNVAIFKDATVKQKEAAWRFIKWFTSREIQAKWALGTGYLPVRKSVLNLPVVKKRFKEIKGLDSVWKQLGYALIEPREHGWLIGRRLLSDIGVEPALRGTMKVEDALSRSAKEVDRALRR
jgi:multiple sugar transport system substrate-binding protein